MSQPSITIAIPTFRRLAYLKQAVASALAQTYAAVEIVVSDNCSGDGTAPWLHAMAETKPGHSVRVLEQTQNLGMVGNWNACLAAATGEWLLLLSDDDYLEPGALSAMMDALEQSPSPELAGVVYCRCRTVDGDGRKLALAQPMPFREQSAEFALQFFRRRRVLFPCGVLLRVADLRAQGGFRTKGITLGCDAIAWSEAAIARGEVICASGILSNYRIHTGNLTSTSQLDFWMADLTVLFALWEKAFAGKPATLQLDLQHACASYYTYFLATVLAGAGKGLGGVLRGLGRFFQYRWLFLRSRHGRLHLVAGVARLLTPGWAETELRRLRNARVADHTAPVPYRNITEHAR